MRVCSFVGTTTDPNTGAVVDQYAIRKQYSQPVQHVQHVTQEQISYVQQMVPEVNFSLFLHIFITVDNV
jgi:hypothetical protein